MKNESFLTYLEQIEELEKDRPFCGHGLSHLLDVARIGSLLAISNALQAGETVTEAVSETYYAAALLHDVGRVRQYQEGIAHETAGIGIADEILTQCGFEEQERRRVLEAIRSHRDEEAKAGEAASLSAVLRRADKISRNCFACKAWKDCKWAEEDKNGTIVF